MRRQTEKAVEEADLVLMLIDARAGVTPLDAHFADWLRRVSTPVVLLANKCEGRAGLSGLAEAYTLGLGDPVPISAEHGAGMGELYDVIRKIAEDKGEYGAAVPEPDEFTEDDGDGGAAGEGDGTRTEETSSED